MPIPASKPHEPAVHALLAVCEPALGVNHVGWVETAARCLIITAPRVERFALLHGVSPSTRSNPWMRSSPAHRA